MPRLQFGLSLIATLLSGCATGPVPEAPTIAELPKPCELTRQQLIEESLTTSDGMDHGPDIGSGEWHSVVEFKLGIRGNNDIPEHGTNDWCRHIENVLTTGGA